MKKTEEEAEFTERKAEAEVELAKLMAELGTEPVYAAMAGMVGSHVSGDMKRRFLEEKRVEG